MESGVTALMLSAVLILGVGFGKLAKSIKLPSVTGYLLAGILFGPYLLGSIELTNGIFLGFSSQFIESVKIIYTVAFGFICFSLGEEIKPNKLKQISKKVVLIAFIQSVATAGLVFVGLMIVALLTNSQLISLPVALVFSALSSASAPTAKFMITRQYKSQGEVTDYMTPIVALDDAFDIILFSFALIILPLFNGESISIFSLLLAPLFEIMVSASIGIFLGVLLGYITKIYRIEGARIVICIGFVLLAVSLSVIVDNLNLHLMQTHLKLSSLLICITMGGGFSLINHEHGIRKKLDSWTYPMFIAFFVFAGANFNIRIFGKIDVLWIGLIYFVLRFMGKYFGTYYGCKLSHESIKMRKTLGVTMLPQADVALGMAFLASSALNQIGLKTQGELVTSVVFVTAIAFEITGHILMRFALKKAGEVMGDTDEDKESEEFNEQGIS